MLLTLSAFLVSIALLVAVHEWGHFAMARACGVKVLKFSIGFGPRITGWTSRRSGTEYQIGLLPLGGFVKMLDEREEAQLGRYLEEHLHEAGDGLWKLDQTIVTTWAFIAWDKAV